MITRSKLSISLAALATVALGCSGSGPRLPDDNNNGITVTPRSDGGVDGDGGSTGSDGGGLVITTPPTITSVELLQSGRDGQDLQLRISGTDPEGDVTIAVVVFKDAMGDDVLITDTDLNGRPDSGKVVGAPNPSVMGDVEFEAVVTFPLMARRQASIVSAEVRLLDEYGNSSGASSASVTAQPVMGLSEPCDPTLSFDRCDEGLGCGGEGDTPVCVPGTNPEMESLSFLTTERGALILLKGRDLDDDVWRIRLEFLDSGGGTVELDLDADGEPDSTEFEIDATYSSSGGEFVLALEPAENFSSLVQQLAATAYDARHEGGNRVTGSISGRPTRANGAACDPWGSDTCMSSAVCYPGIPGVPNACGDKISRRNATCRTAPVLSTSRPKVTGIANGVSLWDAPSGCAALDPKGRPESIAILSLPNGARRVSLSTDEAGTGFDTVLYVMSSCNQSSPTVLGCNDNVGEHIGSSLILENLAPGQYLVVVDSWNPAGGGFELTANIEE